MVCEIMVQSHSFHSTLIAFPMLVSGFIHLLWWFERKWPAEERHY